MQYKSWTNILYHSCIAFCSKLNSHIQADAVTSSVRSAYVNVMVTRLGSVYLCLDAIFVCVRNGKILFYCPFMFIFTLVVTWLVEG